MCEIESLMVAAVAERVTHARDGNTEVHTSREGLTTVHLHGNLIAVVNPATPHAPPVLQVSLAGWDTNTTRSRLNALLREFTTDARAIRIAGKPVLMVDGRATAMDPEAFYPVPLDPTASPEAAALISNLHAREG